MKLKGSDIAKWTKGHWINGIPELIENFTFDSRLVCKKTVFIAMTHGERDGHDFINQATDKGSLGCIVERAVDLKVPQLIVPDTLKALIDIGREVRDLFKGNVIGVTGSCGKTSTKSLIEKAIGQDKAYARKGNWNNKMGVPLSLVDLHGKSYDFAVIEAGISEPNEMSILSSIIKPNLCVITNVGEAHLEGLGSIESVAQEKAKLLKFAQDQCRLIAPQAVLSLEAFKPYHDIAIPVRRIHEKTNHLKNHGYLYQANILGNDRSEVRVFYNNQEKLLTIRTTSSGMVENSVLAFATAIESGVEASIALSGIADWKPDNGRGSIERINETLFYNDTYNANPTSMRDSLSAFSAISASYQNKTYILGVMEELGEASASLHYMVGSALDYLEGDQLILIGESKLAEAYKDGALSQKWPISAIEIYNSVNFYKSNLANSSRAVFLKGSRSCKLESLIPSSG